jgi:hypothetical protein
MSTLEPALTGSRSSPRHTSPTPATTNQCSLRRLCDCRDSRWPGSTWMVLTLKVGADSSSTV